MTVPEEAGTTRKSPYIAGRWRKSSHSGEGQDCVEIDMDRPEASNVGIRDSKDPEGGEIRVSRASFRALRGDARRDRGR